MSVEDPKLTGTPPASPAEPEVAQPATTTPPANVPPAADVVSAAAPPPPPPSPPTSASATPQPAPPPPAAKPAAKLPPAKQSSAKLSSGKPRRRPSERAHHPLVIVGSAFFTLAIVLGILAAFAFAQLRRPGPLEADKTVMLVRNLGFADIGEILKREGVVENAYLFDLGVVMLQARSSLKAGEYLFPRHANIHDVIGILVEGRAVLHQVTIPEGLTSEQVVARLLENDVLTGSVREMPREGSLLPETYRFHRGTTREQILQRMAADQTKLVQEIWARRAGALPLQSPAELITLASIVEKETGKAGERPRVAAVFVNRLNKRMRLQSDPTIIYGLVGGKGSLGRPILRSDIDRPTAYNTYTIDGLPPGPIANPGRAAIEASANPAPTRDLFFVADGTGGHVFAETLEEHNRNVARWREIERQNGQGAAVPAPQPPAATTPRIPTPRPVTPRPPATPRTQ